MFGGCSERKGSAGHLNSIGDLRADQEALKPVIERLHGMSRQVARADHQLTEMSEKVTTSKRDMDTAMEVAAQQTAQVMFHVDSVKDAVQHVQSGLESRFVAIESRLNLVECCIENSKRNMLGELDEVTTSLTDKLNKEVKRLGLSVRDMGRRLSEAEVACRDAQQLDHRMGEVEVICQQATLKLSKVTEHQDNGSGVHQRFLAWCTDVDQRANEFQTAVLSKASLACEPRVEPDACLDGRSRDSRALSTIDPALAAESTFTSMHGGPSADEVPEEVPTRGSSRRGRGSRNRDRTCPSDSLTYWCTANPCAATVPASHIEVASGRSTAPPREDSTTPLQPLREHSPWGTREQYS
jgi:hypothetical protein